MLCHSDERTALFIDGANLYATAKVLGIEIDYKKLLAHFQGKSRLMRAFYYTAIYEEGEYTPLRPLIDWLDYNGFTVVTKPVREYTDDSGRKKVKGNMDIEMAVDMLEMAPKVDHVFLFSGDGDFSSLIEAVKRIGVRTTVISAAETSPPMCSDDLRRSADQFIELKSLRGVLGREFTPKSETKSADKKAKAKPSSPDPMAYEPFKMT